MCVDPTWLSSTKREQGITTGCLCLWYFGRLVMIFFFLDLSSMATMDKVVNRASRLIDDSLTFYINQFFLSNQNYFS